MYKGQTVITMVLLMIVLAVGVGLMFIPERSDWYQYLNLYGKNEMLTLMNYEVNNTRISEWIGLYLCSGNTILGNQLESTINATLSKMNVDTNYIFFIKSGNRVIWAYDKQPTVCAGKINTVVYKVEKPCGGSADAYLVIWRKDENLPEECD
ncbi:hypothetical protein DRN75_00130 [Nanoarchaeota archaeon]|nr:MAG: hypothetical protein DRN75_00130 [Nanoarchaeota archaeon]